MDTLTSHITPAARVIAICGGAANVARLVGRTSSWVYRWTYPKERGGTDGIVPMIDAHLLLAAARAEGLPLTPDDFFPPVQEAAE